MCWVCVFLSLEQRLILDITYLEALLKPLTSLTTKRYSFCYTGYQFAVAKHRTISVSIVRQSKCLSSLGLQWGNLVGCKLLCTAVRQFGSATGSVKLFS